MTALRAQLVREQRKLELVREIGRALGSTLDLDELLTLIAETVTELMEAERSTIYVVDEDASELWSRVAEGEQSVEIRLDVGSGIAGWVAQEGEVLNVPDAYSDDRFDPSWDQVTGYTTRSILCAPLRDRAGKTIGVLQVLNKRTGESFTADDEAFLVALAGQAAVSIENSKLILSLVQKNEELQRTKELLEQRNAELDLLLELEKLVSSSRTVDDLLDRVLGRACDACGADAGAVLVAGRGAAPTRLDVVFSRKGEEPKRFGIKQADGIAGWVMQNDVPVRVADASTHESCRETIGKQVGYEAGSVVCVPMRATGGVIGAIELLDKAGGGGKFTESDEKIMTLIAAVAARAVELARKREEWGQEERLCTIGTLLSGVLHDLKTPMTIISGYVQLMTAATDPKVRQGYAETVLKQFEHISSMTGEILAFARGESKLLVRRVYVHKFVEEIGELLRPELEPKGINLVFDLAYKGTARFDESKMRRVFHNIARNAAEAMPAGGTFTVSVDREDGELVFRFSDTGTGIPAEVEDRLFTSFCTAGKEGGTGLGLAIVKKIVDEHGGNITFESLAGQGTTFRVIIPQSSE